MISEGKSRPQTCSAEYQLETTCQSRKFFQAEYFCDDNWWANDGLRGGFEGALKSFMPASCGVRPPLRTLHRKQAQTMLSQVDGPPRLRGMT